MEISRVGEFTLGWGESLVWDADRGRLLFVDSTLQTLHWLDDGDDELHTLAMPSMPAGLVPTTDGRFVAALHDGLHVVDPDRGTTELLSTYPAELDGRANDASADLHGNLITGKLNIGPGEGSAWRYSPAGDWLLVDDDIANTNGPAVGVIDGEMTLIIGDTSAVYYAYPYEPGAGTVGTRRIFGDTTTLEGHPDGATLDSTGALWCALFGGGQIARFTSDALDRTIPVPVANPTDVTFGGADLDRLFVVSIGADPGSGSGIDGSLLVIDGLDVQGRLEPQFALAGSSAA